MMKRRMIDWFPRSAALALVFAAAMLLQGCSYMGNRLNDARDILDFGVTATPSVKPDFALYFDFFNMLPIGYSNVEGKFIGAGYRQAGILDYRANNWGVLAFGSEQQGAGVFNPNDPRHADPNRTYDEPWPAHDAGFIGAFTGDSPPPRFHYMECTRQLHVGWLGFVLNIRPVEIIDFLVGWTTIDILRDDNIPPADRSMARMERRQERLARRQ